MQRARAGTAARRRLARATAVAATVLATLTAPLTTVSTEAATRPAGYERGIVAAVNKARAAEGLGPLRGMACADQMAEQRAQWMKRNHRAGRLSPRAVHRECGRPLAVEGTAIRRSRPAAMVRGWLRDTEDRRALLDPSVRSIGVGAQRDARGRWYVSAVVLGRRTAGSSSGPVSGAPGPSSSPEGDSSSGGGDPATAPGGEVPADGEHSAAIAELVDAILAETNERRTAAGRPALKRAVCAEEFAGGHSRWMADTGTFEHADLADLADRCGTHTVGENIVMASPELTAEQALDMWMASEGHRANILSRSFTHLGVGVGYDEASGSWYATQDFLGLG